MAKQLVVLMGPPGSGKGTISQMAVEKLPFEHVSVGDLLKWQASEGGELGSQIDFYVRSGKLVPDSVVVETVHAWLKNNAPNDRGLLLDGFPRTRVQAAALVNMLKDDVAGFDPCLVLFAVSDEEVARRLTARRVCSRRECGAVYSLIDKSLSPRNEVVCDRCGSALHVRSDDTKEAVLERLKTYSVQAADLADYYLKQGLPVKRVDAEGSVDRVFERFVSALVDCKVSI